MKRTTRNIFRIIISIVYIIWGIYSPIQVFNAVLALDVGAMLSAGVGILTLLAGIFGLLGLRRIRCRIFGVVIFVVSAVGVIAALPAINTTSIITAVLAWLFIVCL
jgi:hypothetical protein